MFQGKRDALLNFSSFGLKFGHAVSSAITEGSKAGPFCFFAELELLPKCSTNLQSAIALRKTNRKAKNAGFGTLLERVPKTYNISRPNSKN